MRKYVLTICEFIIRAAFLAGLVASAFIWKESPAQAFTIIFLGALAFACYLKLDRIETSLSEEKRYDNVWRRDRIALFGTIFTVLFAIGIILAFAFGPGIAVENPNKVQSEQTTAIVGGMNAVEATTTKSAEFVVNAVQRLEERMVPSIVSMEASMIKLASHTKAIEKAGKDIELLEKSTLELRDEVVSLKKAVSGLNQTVRSLAEINRKILEQKTEK